MVRFGILGAGNIAHRFAASLAQVKGAELVAASRRSALSAEEFLAEVPHAHDAHAAKSHADLLADPEVDAIYLALPHALHREWALAALRAGKPVLCEKPATLTAGEMREVARVAHETGVLFMEAMKPRFQPVYQHIIAALEQVGPLLRVEASLCNDMLSAVETSGSYHMTPGPGSGVLLDCGTYCASWIAALLPNEPQVTSVTSIQKGGVDVYALANLRAGAAEVTLECAFDRAKPRTCTITGEHGQLVVEELHRPQRATLRLEDGAKRELAAPYEPDDFSGEITHFVQLVEAGAPESPVMSLDDSIRCAALLDEVRAHFSEG